MKIRTYTFIVVACILSILSYIPLSLSDTEIIIEYEVTSNCAGPIVLTLNPSSPGRGGSTEPSASGLTECDVKTVYFRQSSCGGTTKSSCTVSGSGCVGSSFTVPDVLGTYTYYACIDINDDSDFSDTGESDSVVVNLENTGPLVSDMGVPIAPVDLLAGSTKSISISGSYTDADGFSDVSSCTCYLWNQTIDLTPSYATHTDSTCTLTNCLGSSCDVSCSFSLDYYDFPGTWTAGISAEDAASNTHTETATFDVNEHTAIDVPEDGIAFGSLIVGKQAAPAANNPLKIYNHGNTRIRLYVSGTDSVGVTDTSWVIDVSNLTYNSTVPGMVTPRELSDTIVSFTPPGGIPQYPKKLANTDDEGTMYIYNYMSIPSGWKAQTYSMTYFVQGEKY